MEVEALGLQLAAEGLDEALDVALALAALGVEAVGDLAVGLRLEVLQRQVLQLRLDLVEPEPVGERREQLLRFGGDAELLLGRHGAQRPHVVETVGELDQDDAHV